VPIGVRSLAIDAQRDLIFVSSLSGVIEVRSASDYATVSRTRLSPWIHWLEPIPEFGEVIVSVAFNGPLVWQYDPPNLVFSPFDLALQMTEKIYMYFLGSKSLFTTNFSNSSQKNIFTQSKPEKYLVLSKMKFFQRPSNEMFQSKDQYSFQIAKDRADFIKILEAGNCFDGIYIDLKEYSGQPIRIELMELYYASQEHCVN